MKFRFSRKQLCIPYAAFLIIFVIAPLLVVIYYAFTNGEGKFTLDNLTGFFTSPNTIGTLCYSLAVAVTTTLVCLVLFTPLRTVFGLITLTKNLYLQGLGLILVPVLVMELMKALTACKH